MIKTHSSTGLKYLCITTRENHDSYTGSGVYWRKHLKAHGCDILTDVIYRSDDYADFVEMCNYYSEKYDVARSDEWANMVPETGYNNNDGKPNVVLFWEYADDETKQSIIQKRGKAISDNHFSKREDAAAIYELIGSKLASRWERMSDDEKELQMKGMWKGRAKFFNDKSENYDQWRSHISNSMKELYRNMDPEVLSEKNRKARLNTSKESAESRKSKIREVYATGKHDHLFERYSNERQGSKNPAARKVSIDGVRFDCIKDAVDKLNLTRAIISNRLNSDKWYEWRRL